MRLTEDNYEEYNTKLGIIVIVPKYAKRLYLYTTNGITYKGISYDLEFNTFDERVEDNYENLFDSFNVEEYYYFKDLKEFCEWFLQNQICLKDEKLKRLLEIQNSGIPQHYFQDEINELMKPEKVKENKLYSQEEIRKKINPEYKINQTRRDILKDVIEYIHKRENISILSHGVREGITKREDLNIAVAQLEDWLDETV